MSFRTPAVFAGVALTALLSGAGVAYATTHSSAPAAARTTSASTTPSSSAPATTPATQPPGKRAGRWFGHLGLGPGLGGLGLGGPGGGAIHGQLTVPKSGGGYQNVDVQSGIVSAVSPTSITVKSADGFTATYTVSGSTEVNAQSAGIGSVKTGDTVFVTATAGASAATASDITDITALKNSRGAFGFPVPTQRQPADSGGTSNT